MMFKCQKCGFENQMGSIFCRECGEKLDMNAIDPNKLQKDVDKEKLLKKTKKRIKSAISTLIFLIFLAAFLGVIFYNGGLREYEEPTVNAASVNQKYNSAVRGGNGGQTKFSYAEINAILKSKVVQPLSEIDSFAKVTNAEVAFDAEKEEPVIYLWISIKDKVPVIYTVHGDFSLIKPAEGEDEPAMPVELNVKRLDIGRLPIFYRSDIFLNGFDPLLNNDTVIDFFRRAQEVMFTADGMTVNMSKNVPAASNSPAPSAAASPLRSNADSAKAEAARQAAEEKRQKQEEAKQKAEEAKREREEKARQLAEERKQKQEEARQKAEEAKREREEKQRQLEEERRQRVEDARREREERRRERERDRNNGYGGSSRRSSRNRY